MRKIIIAMCCVLFTNLKLLFIKITHLNNFHFCFLHLIRPFTELDFHIKSNIRLGKMIRTGKYCRIRVRKNAKFEIGDNSSFNDGCILVCHDSIKIGNNVQFGPNCLIYDHDHDYRNENGLMKKKYVTKPISIGDNTFIGANSLILKGVSIGYNSVIAAGSIVTNDIPDNSVFIQKRLSDRRHR